MKQRILIAEDDTNIRHVLKLQLESAGYEVIAVEDGIKALEEVNRQVPDLILLDIMMPKMDGHEVCRRLKAGYHTSKVPIIMLTAKSTENDKVNGLEIGANDYLTKPYSSKELVARVRGILQWSSSEREANPLTGLPGNVSIETEGKRRVVSHEPFVFAICDVDDFKEYNDYYGYVRGDQAIKMTASVVTDVVKELGGPDDFVGHIGGDDFVFITTPDRADAIGERIKAEFEQRVLFLYNEADRRRGYIEVRNRRGDVERFRPLTITIAMVDSQSHKISHFAQVSAIAAELKAYGKSMRGSVVVKERRTIQEKVPGTKTGT
ncbi:MAG: response regulator [Candidatus Eisenbacteria bacterium]|nr:response regulator [Candidatus Eisenbacteria bacterium]